MKKIYNLSLIVVFLLLSSSKVFAGGCACSDAPTANPVLGVISGITLTSATATWTAAAHCGGITGYQVEVSLTSGGANITGYPVTVAGTVLTTGLGGLLCGTTYFVRVRGALNTACTNMFTPYSNIRSFTTGACPPPTCTDGILNNGETAIDCGGPNCAACPSGTSPACPTICTTYASGTTWVAPAGVTSVTVQTWGGGGAGGGVNVSGTVSRGGGGAGGSFSEGVVAVTPGNSYGIIVGAGGTGASGVAGGAGGTSSFGGTSVVAVGGAGGNAGVNSNGTGAAGSSTGNTGTVVFAGGNGSNGVAGAATAGSGGGGAGTSAVGGNAGAGTGGAGGATGGGAGGIGGILGAVTPGSSGTAPGGAGGGAVSNTAGSAAGGNGGAGQVTVCYTPPACSGTPSGGTTSSSPASLACSGGTVTLSNTASQSACGITGQWQSSANGTTWSNIAGATSSAFTPTVNSSTYYRYIATCTISTLSAPSNTILVASTATTACYTCFDGIQNQGETGIDCGGPCALSCVSQSVAASTCGACPAAISAVVYPTTCAQVGTSAYNLNSPAVNFVSCASFTAPVPSPTCATVGSLGTWIKVDLAPGVTQVQLSFNSGTVANGNNSTFAAAYQGTGCGALTAVPSGCQNSVYFVSGTQYVNQVFFTGLNPNQDLWIFMFNDAGKTFNLNYNLIGTAGAPSNTTCAESAPADGTACNLGASGATFPTPGSAGVSCTGGGWGSNENTTFYSFTPTATTATLTVANIACNNGTSGAAQFGVWTSCAAIGTYTSSSTFLGCVVGTSNLNMTGLTAGQTYYIAADGNAGNNCKWTFTGTNLLLPIELLNFNAFKKDDYVDINWKTASEKNNDYFTIERSLDGINFKAIEIIKGADISTNVIFYSTKDMNPSYGLSYYRLKQTDFNGKFSYSNIVSVDFDNKNDLKFEIVPNPNYENEATYIVLNRIPENVLSITIQDLNGVLLYEAKKRLDSNKFEIPNEFTNGIYLVKIVSSNSVQTKRMMIK